MVWDIIISGIGDTFGYELMTALILIFMFLLVGMFRGIGTTALLGLFVLMVYLFSSFTISGINLLDSNVLLIVLVLFGLFIGYLVFVLFIRE